MDTELTGPTNLELLRWILRRRYRFRIKSNSMLPLLCPGDEILFDPRAYRQAEPQPGDVVIARRPDRVEVQIIKRVVGTTEDGRYILMGDNRTESTDSRAFGPVPIDKILGRVTSRFS